MLLRGTPSMEQDKHKEEGADYHGFGVRCWLPDLNESGKEGVMSTATSRITTKASVTSVVVPMYVALAATASTCRVCSSPMKTASRFCGRCGTSQLQTDSASERSNCPTCGFLNQRELALTGQPTPFCDTCGEPLFLRRREI